MCLVYSLQLSSSLLAVMDAAALEFILIVHIHVASALMMVYSYVTSMGSGRLFENVCGLMMLVAFDPVSLAFFLYCVRCPLFLVYYRKATKRKLGNELDAHAAKCYT